MAIDAVATLVFSCKAYVDGKLLVAGRRHSNLLLYIMYPYQLRGVSTGALLEY